MKSLIFLIACFFQINTFAQLIKMDYYPEQPKEVSDDDYQIGKRTLQRTYEKIKEDNHKLYSTTYWNVASAYTRMGANPDKIYQLFLKAKEEGNEGFCTAINFSLELCEGDFKKSRYYRALGERYVDLIKECKGINALAPSIIEMEQGKETMDLTGLNESLIDRLIQMMEKDQRFRGDSYSNLKKNWEMQKTLDLEVQEELIKIFEKDGYPGKDMVGNKYQDYACLMLEHVGDLKSQEKYLSIIIESLKKNQVSKDPVRMLIDRMYTTKTGKQIFGSHAGYPYADDEVIKEIEQKYGL